MTPITDNPYAAPNYSHAAPPADARQPPRILWTFCGLQPQWLRSDRFYKIYITDYGLYGGWLGGQFHDKLSIRFQLFPLYLILIGFILVEPLAAWIVHRRRRLESSYDSLIVEPEAFLRADQRNFFIAQNSITSITISSQKSHWTLWANSGIIDIKRGDDAPLRLIVRDSRELSAIVDEFAAARYRLESSSLSGTGENGPFGA